MKRIFTFVIAAAVLLTAAAALADTPVIKKTEYEGKGFVEVDFRGKVNYNNPAISVTDENGKAYTAEIYELDDDDISFRILNIAEGMNYSVTVNGVRAGVNGAFESVSTDFRVPAVGELIIADVDFDADDAELEIDFNGRVSYHNPELRVTDAAGTVYAANIVELDDDSIEARVDGLVRGETYSLELSGVQLANGGSDAVIEINFTAD